LLGRDHAARPEESEVHMVETVQCCL
jgi:hypothetical protein